MNRNLNEIQTVLCWSTVDKNFEIRRLVFCVQTYLTATLFSTLIEVSLYDGSQYKGMVE